MLTLENLRSYASNFCTIRDWNKFHLPINLALALSAECGELCEIFQWKSPSVEIASNLDEWYKESFTEKDKIHIGEEIADVFIYSTRLSDVCNIDLAKAIINELNKSNFKTAMRPSTNEWIDLSFSEIESTIPAKYNNLSHRQTALAIQSYVGSLCSLFQNKSESFSTCGLGQWSENDLISLSSNIANICILLISLSLKCNHKIGQCITDKYSKNEAKYPVNLVRGSSEKYTTYESRINNRNVSNNFSVAFIKYFKNTITLIRSPVFIIGIMSVFIFKMLV
eukprot:gene5596-7724_t